jgi:PAS domain S-box-containing protein
MGLREFIEQHSGEILDEWEADARQLVPPAEGQDRAALRDQGPQLLEDLAKVIGGSGEHPCLESIAAAHAEEHATERIREGAPLSYLVRELALLRACILRSWRKSNPQVSVDDAELLTCVVDHAIERAVDRYFQTRAELLEGFEQIAQAAFQVESLDAFLDRVLHIFKRHAPSVDSAAILLREGDHLTVRAAVGLEEEVRQRFTLRLGEGFEGTVAATGKPLLVREAWSGPLVRSHIIRERRTRALYGVPLFDGDEVVGVAHIGSITSADIPDPEKRLFAALAQRATSAIIKHRLREQLAAARGLFESLVDNMPSMSWMARPDGYIDFYNRRWYEYTGTTFEEMRGWGWQKIHDPEVLPEAMKRWKHSIETGEPFEMEFPLRGADGVYRWFLTRIEPLRDASGRVIRWCGMNTNIDGQRRAAEFRERFIGIVSHDLRNPLSAISMSATTILKSPDLAPALRSPAARIVSNVGRMSRMVSDLLDFTRGRLGGGIPIERRPTDLRDVVSRARDELKDAHPESEILVESRGATAGSWDPDRLAQVLINLGSNAIQHGTRDRPVRIAVDGSAADVVLLEVHNEGGPIPADLLPHMFDPFWRARSGRTDGSAQGLGLGMFIAREILHSHGGDLQVASTAAEGTTFRATLPRTGHDPGEQV